MIAIGDLHFGLTLEVLFREYESKPWSPMIAWLMQERGRRDDDGRSALDQYLHAGVVHSGKCFCPSRSHERIGNHCGHGTPLPLLCRLPPSWPARQGLGLGDARCGESAHRSSPCRVSGAPGLWGLRQVDQTAGRLHDESRLWRGHQEQLAGDSGCGGEPVTRVRHLRLHPAIACWARLSARRHYRCGA
jgi:hypothetical protein